MASAFVRDVKAIETRRNMVTQQVLTNHVNDPEVVRVISGLPREVFVPREYEHLAYVDSDVPLGMGSKGVARFVIEPMVLARALQLLRIQPDEAVLDVGCATGYSTAAAASFAKQVIGLECDEALASRAGNNLHKLRISNAKIVIGALEAGHPSAAPYPVMLVLGGAEALPATLLDQLAEGGRVIWVRSAPELGGVGRVALGSKFNGVFTSRDYFDTSSRCLPGLRAVKPFHLV